MTLIRSSRVGNRLAEKKNIANPWGYTKGGGGERGGMVMNQVETCIIIMTCYIQSTLTPLMISFISLIRKSFAAICFT